MRKQKIQENFLEKVPVIPPNLQWNRDDTGAVTVEIEHNKIADKILQKLMRKPKISYIHLDDMGNFIWKTVDGEKNLIQIGEEVHDCFGKTAEPLYPRLVQYFQTLEHCGFIIWKTE